MTSAPEQTRRLSLVQFQGLVKRLQRYGNFATWMPGAQVANFPADMVVELFRQDDYLATKVDCFVPECRVCGSADIRIAFFWEVTRTNGNFGLTFTPVPKFLNCEACGQVYYTSGWLEEIRTLQERIEIEERRVSWAVRSFMFANHYTR